MARKLKVFGGFAIVGGRQRRTVIGAETQKEAAARLHMSLYEFSRYWCETGTPAEVAARKARQCLVAYRASLEGEAEYAARSNDPELATAVHRALMSGVDGFIEDCRAARRLKLFNFPNGIVTQGPAAHVVAHRLENLNFKMGNQA